MTSFSWSFVGAQLVVALLSVLVYRRFLSPLKTIPGPTLASVSRLWHLYYIVRGDQNLKLIELHKKHGHFVRIAHNEVSVSHPDGIKKILLAPLHKGSWYKLLAIPDYRFQTPMSTTDPKKKTERSKHFAAGYTLTNVLQSEPAVDSVVKNFIEWLDKFSQSKQPVDIDKYLTFTAFDVVGEILFSKQFGFIKEGKDIGNAIANGLALNVYAATMGFYRWVHVLLVGNPIMTKLNILPMGHLYDTTVNALDQRLDNRDSRFDSVAHWFRAIDKNPAQVKLRDVYAIATGAVGAGSDTVSGGLQAFIYYMLRHPNAWNRVRSEIDEAVKTQGICQDEVIQFADTQKLPFLQACFKEALRIFGPVPMGLPRLAPKGGITIGDQHFPEGTTLSINPWVIHHSEEFWGPDASEFNPDRWLRPEIASQEKYFIPWGVGYNSCPGQHIARMEMYKIAATLLPIHLSHQLSPIMSLETLDRHLASVQASPATIELLKDLHTQALTEPAYVSTDSQPATAALDRFVALEPDKCALVYLMLRACGARHVVEAGTSFGVSTIWLALAVAQNAKAQNADGKVIATENEPSKAKRAREHWSRAGDEVEKWIDLREGDLRETLKTDLPEQIDFLLLDIWSVLAMPTLAVVKPRLRPGALVVVDNIISGRAGYTDLIAHLEDPSNGFKSTTVPYPGGLHVAVYTGA
ncbi:Pisatin demethylase-like protein [Colletotrichum karsti]|uniref:Pisatin demethylase-like protein n=1 Tax=Colletotrichum karsti TaxID=1095194 RepID=A0A9P6HX70_9PEZI|nr:Pisatin demethylase-like protein [Colletotrichum karsti]KAF9870671.1 Pisatin demethylase-like protein [Colletotrichum karsti]